MSPEPVTDSAAEVATVSPVDDVLEVAGDPGARRRRLEVRKSVRRTGVTNAVLLGVGVTWAAGPIGVTRAVVPFLAVLVLAVATVVCHRILGEEQLPAARVERVGRWFAGISVAASLLAIATLALWGLSSVLGPLAG